jgi:predicted dehydrogenase
MSPIRVGVVGLSYKGWAGWPLINALLQPPLSDKYILSALSTRSEKSASDTAKKYSELVKHDVKAYHGDTSSIAKDKDLDLVAVVIPSPSHLKAAMPIIEAGHNLFVEWPVGANLEETKQMRDAARKKGIRTMIGCQGRQSPAIKKVGTYCPHHPRTYMLNRPLVN